MDIKSNELHLDRTEAPPEQKQSEKFLDLITDLSKGDIVIDNIWHHREYDVPDFGDSIIRITIERLTEKAEQEDPDLPLGAVTIFRISEDGEIHTDYEIARVNGKLKIDRGELIKTPENEEGKKVVNPNEMDPEEVLKIVRDNYHNAMDKIERESENRDFERKIGASYVDNKEAREVIDTLIKLATKEKPYVVSSQQVKP